MTKYCQNCNARNPDNANYCIKCKTKLSRISGNSGSSRNPGRVECRFCNGTGRKRDIFGFMDVCPRCGGRGTLPAK